MPGIFILHGNDEFAMQRKLGEFESEYKDPSIADLNITRLDARTMTENELNNAVNSMPFLAANRLVSLAAPSARYTTPAARNKFLELLSGIPGTTRLVIHEMMEPKEVEKHWLVKWGAKNAPLVQLQSFMLPRQRDMPGWIAAETKKQGGQIQAQAASRLAEMVGVDTRQAGMEISKLLAYVNWERPIQGSDVEAICVLTAQQSVFEFVDALSQGNGKTAQKLMHRLFENEDPFSLWGMVIRQFRLLIQAREILDGRGNKDDVARALGVHPFVAEKTTNQARRFSIDSLEEIHHRLLDIDEGVKAGRITLDLALDLLVSELAN